MLLQQVMDDLAPLGARSAQAPQAKLIQGLGRELKVLETLNDPQGVYARLPFGLGIR